MSFFADDCTFDMPRGPDPWGSRLVGRDQVRKGLARRIAGIPDVHYGEDRHVVCGNRGVSEWRLTGTTTSGGRVDVRGCDLWEFADGKVLRKDSYWKRETLSEDRVGDEADVTELHSPALDS
jgi:ketosteroid isomerase-like protein